MPLSDREMQVLRQIERDLSGARPRPVVARSMMQLRLFVGVLGSLAVVLVGCALVYLGLRVAGGHPNSTPSRDAGTALGVVGYGVISLAAHAGARTFLDRRRHAGRRPTV